MGDLVNLRQVKKRRAAAEAAARAAENRVRHGRSGEQKQADRRAAEGHKAQVDNARLSPTNEDAPTGGQDG